ncbi:nitrogen regulation protein NR(I) [Propionivibrio sp.]|uniref:nitrogen regulation protein NR(I) n=1 Tax=Propionivibrio sp. TaxID=2212460 RepID=UPI0025F92CB2|nr:nitrogen regulation protein NR(I) [Propionivibrio sp.]MBK7355479.1 nitrogen regulation protein NR(I) [Propionivibrio sp.]MBK8400855.1 nitrogen regulation protein NR(I) [Propionivibrio sp.]MBK8744479.1 nitrogen regulation protein NR(I) [Propionivibrio sp.]MBK8895017.1 nitrogen regulation protein NR(I) [Propionivibrio sp.]MBL0209169.1 nitrogen regulation protein NR(I) [Propionivibrio sp.]
MKPVWIVDDDKSIRWVLEKTLAREQVPFKSFSSASEALSQLDLGVEPPQVLLSDIRMPGESGLDLLKQVKERYPSLPVIIMTAYSDLDSAVAAFQGGAFEYLPKPFDVDQALELIRRAIDESSHQVGASAEVGLVPEILGQAPAMQEVFRAIGRLSQSNATVMITGESGSGKELVARAVHRHSLRSDKPFIAINTAAIPRDLLESELFGHERGAFTGAAVQRRGRFEQAEGGTLFLDEIGDMPSELQTRLLRVLSDGNYYRVGGHSPIKANVRIIAATHQNLENRVKEGLFREDLFHRLNVIRVRLPSLRERREDIPILARHFMHKSAQDLGVEAKRFSDAALRHLASLDLPGNVRQLENICHWLTVMAPGQQVDLADLPVELRDSAPQSAVADWESVLAIEVDRLLAGQDGKVHDRLTDSFERVLITRALAYTGGRRIEAAQALGIGRNTITRKIQDLGLADGRKHDAPRQPG